jgi:hypothetical protein
MTNPGEVDKCPYFRGNISHKPPKRNTSKLHPIMIAIPSLCRAVGDEVKRQPGWTAAPQSTVKRSSYLC